MYLQIYLVAIDGILQAPANYTINNVSPRTLSISTVPSGSSLIVVSLSNCLKQKIEKQNMPITKATQNVITPNIVTTDTNQTISTEKHFKQQIMLVRQLHHYHLH